MSTDRCHGILSVQVAAALPQMLVPKDAYPVVAVSEGLYTKQGFHYVLAHVTGEWREL